LQGLADVVEAVQQEMLAERVHLERDFLAGGPHDDLPFEIDGEARVAAEAGVVHQRFADLARQLDRQDAVLEAVAMENVGEIGRNHAAYAEIQQRPGRVFSGRAAAEILEGDQDLGLPEAGLVQHELRFLAAVLVEAQRVEQVLAEAAARDRLQETRGDDFVGVDVRERERRRDTGQGREGGHG